MSSAPILATTKSTVARALAVLGVVALAVGAILSIPRVSASAESAPLDIALVDVSKSVVARAAGEWGSATTARLREWAHAAEANGHDAALVAFGREVRVGSIGEPAGALLEQDGRGGARETRLAAALNLARSLGRDRRPGTITIFGDGTFTGDDPARIADELALDGFTIVLVPERARAWNLALSPLAVARELEVGAPIVVSAVVRVDRGTLAGGRGRAEFEARDSAGVRRKRVDFELGASERVPLHVDLGAAHAGLVQIEGTVAFESRVPDAVSEDDRSLAVLRCAGSLVVGRLDPPRASPAPPRIEGLDFVALEREQLASRLAHLDALVTSDAHLTLAEQRLVQSFVERGGGWLDLAGSNWIRERSSAGAPLRDVGALVPDRSTRPRDVIFLLDASGSMAGPPFDAVRAQVGALVDSALPQDDVSVRFFADDVSAPIRFGTDAERNDRSHRPALDEAVRTARSASGPTRILAALEKLVTERAGSGRDVLVLLLSDGREEKSSDQVARLERLKQSRAAARMRVVAVAPLADVDRDFLTAVADSFVDLADPSLWPGVFRQELLENEIIRRAGMPIVPVTGGAEPAATLAAATRNLPPVDAAVRAEVAAGAQLLWTDDRGAPFAAFARRGSGRVITIAFEPALEPLAPFVRALARTERARKERLHVEGDTIVLANVAADFPATAHARIDTGAGAPLELTFTADARGLDPLTTRTASIPPGLDAEPGIAVVHVDGGASGALELALERPRAAEFAFEPRRFVPPAVSATQAAQGAAQRSHPFAPASLGLGVLAVAAAALLGAFSARRR